MAAVFDLAAAAGFLTAACAIAYALLAHASRVPRSTALLGIGAMLSMLIVSVINFLDQAGIRPDLHSSEEYVEVLFLPLMVYLMYSAHAHEDKAREEREKAIVGLLDERLSTSLAELGEQRLEMLQALTVAIDARDHYTALHSMHVADYACAIAYQLGMSEQLRLFEQAGLLHDIGKIGIPDELLLKPSRLTGAEYEVMKTHVEGSARILHMAPFLSALVPVIRHHHERWDGEGYPDGLRGEEIPCEARVLAVADAFDAMTTDRPYRLAMGVTEARAVLVQGRGSQWDPVAVDAMVKLLDEGIVTVDRSVVAA